MLMRGDRLEVPPRDKLPGDTPGAASYAAYIELMQHCWAEGPAERPDFEEISARLRQESQRGPRPRVRTYAHAWVWDACM